VRRIDISDLTPERLDSALFRAALDRYGWRQAGGRRGLYDRFTNEKEPRRKLLIPLDPQRPDYQELIEDALHVLAGSELAEANRVLQHLVATPGDEIRFCKDVPTVGGAIPWSVGDELFKSAGNALKASAKASTERRASFGSQNYRIANDFLNAVLMGQTEVGSYVVTAYTPPNQEFFEKESQRREYLFGSSGAHTGREVVQVMRDVLAITREALDENARTERLEQFDEAVQYGLSKEMASAIKSLVAQSDGAAVTIDWSRAFDPLADEADGRQDVVMMERVDSVAEPVRSEVEFKPTDYPVLVEVEKRLGAPTQVEEVTVTGTVEVLTRQVGKLGVIVLDVRSGSPASKMRVQLPASDYNRALEAHREEYVIRLRGRQERRGNFFWLRDPSPVTTVGPAIETEQERRLGEMDD
jgi:hypothetical protein